MEEKLPYFEILVNDYLEGKINKGVFHQLLLKDPILRDWFHMHQMLFLSVKELTVKQCGKTTAD